MIDERVVRPRPWGRTVVITALAVTGRYCREVTRRGPQGPLGWSRRYRLASEEEGPLRPADLERLMIHGVAGRPQVMTTAITIFRYAMRHPQVSR